jgi:hypothetical protein
MSDLSRSKKKIICPCGIILILVSGCASIVGGDTDTIRPAIEVVDEIPLYPSYHDILRI